MSNPILPALDPVGFIRTYTPVLWGSALTFLIAKFTWFASIIVYVDVTFGTTWRDLAIAATTAAVIALYYWGARKLGQKWPKLEKWLLGSSAVPNYTAR